MATGDLIASTYFKTLAGISASTWDSIIAQLITDDSAMVKRYCNRNFLAAARLDVLDGTGRPYLFLPEYPVIDFYYLSDDWADYLQVRYVGDCEWASVEVELATSLKLRSSLAGTVTTQTLAFSTYTTCTTLVAAINALPGWEGQRVTTAEEYQDPDMLRAFESGDAKDVWLTIEGVGEPVEDFSIKGGEGEGYLIKDSGVWTKGRQNYIARYDAGYGTTDGTEAALIAALPADFKHTVYELVHYHFLTRTADLGLQSERLGDYAYVRKVTGISIDPLTGFPLEIVAGLNRYKRDTMN